MLRDKDFFPFPVEREDKKPDPYTRSLKSLSCAQQSELDVVIFEESICLVKWEQKPDSNLGQ